jgi:hypothetical protein
MLENSRLEMRADGCFAICDGLRDGGREGGMAIVCGVVW